MPARILRWTVCVVLALGGAACGGGDDDGGASDSSSAAAAPTAAATADGAGAASESAGGGGDDGGDSRDDGRTYTVKSGDTLSSIAQELGTTVEALVEANDITDPDVIDIGQQLRIPSN
jgi:LysM repeat protein